MKFTGSERFAKAVMALQGNAAFKEFTDELAIHAEHLNQLFIDAPEDKLPRIQGHVQQLTSIIEEIAYAPDKLKSGKYGPPGGTL